METVLRYRAVLRLTARAYDVGPKIQVVVHLYLLMVMRKVASGRLLGQATHGAVAVSFAQKLLRMAVSAVPEHLARKTRSQQSGQMPSSGSGAQQEVEQ